MPTNQSNVPIALAIQSLRRELSQALTEGEGQNIRFELGPIEIEFQVEVSWDTKVKGSGKGGITFGVISLGEASGEVEANYTKGRTHKIKLILDPVNSEGGNVKVSAADARQRPD